MKSVFEDLKNEERKIERSRIEELIRSENGENFIKQGGRQKNLKMQGKMKEVGI